MAYTYNPYTLQKVTKYTFLSNDEVNLQLNLIDKAYFNWKNTDVTTKQQLGTRLSKLLSSEKNEIAKQITSEMGKPIREAEAEVDKCIELVNYINNNFITFLKPEKLDENVHIHYNTTGGVLGIMPWNFPLWQVFRYAYAAIMAGNVAMLKHAPITFGCGKLLNELFEKSGFPKHVFTNFIITEQQVEQLIAHKITQGVCVTGSTKAGKAVASLAGKYLKKTVLELGGTDACVLFEDANFETDLPKIFKARMVNTGQVCIAPKRIFVPAHKIESSTHFFKSQLNTIVLGDPFDKNTTMGPIAKADFLNTLQHQVNKFIENGAHLIAGGTSRPPFFEPTLLVVNPDNKTLDEEVFGPVICLIPFDNETDLLDQVNNSEYGLGCAIWTQNKTKAKEWAHKVASGYVAVNQIVKSDVRYPFGGIKNSGYGKELGAVGFQTFLNAKTVVM